MFCSLALWISAPGYSLPKDFHSCLEFSSLYQTGTAFILECLRYLKKKINKKSCNTSKSILWYSAKLYFTFFPFFSSSSWPACSGFSLPDQKSTECSYSEVWFLFRHPRASPTFRIQMQGISLSLFLVSLSTKSCASYFVLILPGMLFPPAPSHLVHSTLNEQVIGPLVICLFTRVLLFHQRKQFSLLFKGPPNADHTNSAN